LKLIACEILAREICAMVASSTNRIDVEFMPKGLHDIGQEGMVARLTKVLDQADGGGYDAVLFGYGLCGNGLVGLSARSTKLVLPRAHDCITLFLGDRARYKDEFENRPGTYWYTLDYIERKDSDGTTLSLGSGLDTDINAVYDEYVEKYGVGNADYLMEVMGAWQSHYQRAVFIDMGVGDGAAVEAVAQSEATRRGWIFERVAGDLVLIRRLLAGDWGTDFLSLEPGQQITMTYDDNVVGCLKHDQDGG